MTPIPLTWLGIVRLGLVQTALGSIVVLTTSTLNRVMVVELALPAMLPGLLVALHYAVQVTRPRFGYGSDVGGRRTPWIVGGMAVLGTGGIGAAVATAWMATDPWAGIVLAAISFLLIGAGVGAAGTTLLVLLAKRVEEHRRAAAATIVWVMMIAGFIITTAVVGHVLDPFSLPRLIVVSVTVSALAFAVTLMAVRGIEGDGGRTSSRAAPETSFRAALSEVWNDRRSRRFAIFVFLSMLAYSAQDLILEPFAGTVFGLTPGASTRLSSIQHGGVLAGMVLVAFACSAIGGRRLGSLPGWTIGGCVASAAALLFLASASLIGPDFPLRSAVFALGVANGAYAVAAIGSMMALAGGGPRPREGVRMGLWGAAQAIAFGLGGFAGTLASDIARYALGSPAAAYATVFGAEAVLFLVAAVLAARLNAGAQDQTKMQLSTRWQVPVQDAGRG